MPSSKVVSHFYFNHIAAYQLSSSSLMLIRMRRDSTYWILREHQHSTWTGLNCLDHLHSYLWQVTDRMKIFQSHLRILLWIFSCVHLCEVMANVTLPERGAGTFSAISCGLYSVSSSCACTDICRAATQSSSVHTFASHYAISQQSRDDARFGHVLQSFRQTPVHLQIELLVT